MDDPLLSYEVGDDELGVRELHKEHGYSALVLDIFGTVLLLASIPLQGVLWVRAQLDS